MVRECQGTHPVAGQGNAPFTGTLEGGMTIVIYTAGTGAGNGLMGDAIVAIGLNGYTGTVPSVPFS